eukprot:4602020-Amphidinium_carterae.1
MNDFNRCMIQWLPQCSLRLGLKTGSVRSKSILPCYELPGSFAVLLLAGHIGAPRARGCNSRDHSMRIALRQQFHNAAKMLSLRAVGA